MKGPPLPGLYSIQEDLLAFPGVVLGWLAGTRRTDGRTDKQRKSPGAHTDWSVGVHGRRDATCRFLRVCSVKNLHSSIAHACHTVSSPHPRLPVGNLQRCNKKHQSRRSHSGFSTLILLFPYFASNSAAIGDCCNCGSQQDKCTVQITQRFIARTSSPSSKLHPDCQPTQRRVSRRARGLGNLLLLHFLAGLQQV